MRTLHHEPTVTPPYPTHHPSTLSPTHTPLPLSTSSLFQTTHYPAPTFSKPSSHTTRSYITYPNKSAPNSISLTNKPIPHHPSLIPTLPHLTPPPKPLSLNLLPHTKTQPTPHQYGTSTLPHPQTQPTPPSHTQNTKHQQSSYTKLSHPTNHLNTTHPIQPIPCHLQPPHPSQTIKISSKSDLPPPHSNYNNTPQITPTSPLPTTYSLKQNLNPIQQVTLIKHPYPLHHPPL